MEAIAIEDTSKRLILELRGEGHTLLNVLKNQLWTNEHIKVATYHINHPLIGIPQLIVETDGQIKPRKAITEAATKLSKEVERFRTSLDKAL